MLPNRAEGPLVAVIDPDAASRRLIGLLLGARGFQVAEYDSGRTALACWHRHDPPAAVMIDLSLPDTPALPLMQKLREMRPAPVAIVLTPGRDPQMAAQAMREGAYEHHAKPIEPDRLIQAVGRAVERFHLGMRLHALEERLGNHPVNDDAPAFVSDAFVPLPELERREIRRALQATGGKVGKAAKLLGLSRATLYRRLSDVQSG
jgi:DNA-binding NtrC family response regulator